MTALRTVVGFITAFVLLNLVTAAAPAVAGIPKLDVSNDVVTCHTLSATAKVRPALTFTGTPTSTAIVVTGIVDGCVVSGPVPATMAGPSRFVARLRGTTDSCVALGGTQPLVGSLVVKWNASAATPLLQPSSTVAVTAMTGAAFNPAVADPAFDGVGLRKFTFGIGGVTGAFTGGTGGTASILVAVAGQDIASITAACGGTGIKSLDLGFGTVTLH